jgi:hypothetical protein
MAQGSPPLKSARRGVAEGWPIATLGPASGEPFAGQRPLVPNVLPVGSHVIPPRDVAIQRRQVEVGPGSEQPARGVVFTSIPRELLYSFRSLLIGGRWLLVAAESTMTVLILVSECLSERTVLALLLLTLYNAVSLVVVHRGPLRHLTLSRLLSVDLLFVAIVSHGTGDSQSPFLGQCYLIIFAAALSYGFAGGMAAGVASALITAVLAYLRPAGLWEDIRDLVPYFLLAGAYSGFLMARMQVWFQQYQDGVARERQRELQAEATRREMELARSMQEAALPAAPPPVAGLDLAARSQFAREVGGDFYLFLTDEERVGLVIGDVSGHGIPAALTATSIGHLLPWLRPLEDPRQALDSLNQDLAERLPTDSFVTIMLAEVDRCPGRLRLWNAGHPPALLWRAQEARVVEARSCNPLLGVFPSWDGRPEEWPLLPGDLLALYSDGLVEVRDARGEPFGSARAAEVLARNAGGSADAIAAALIQAAMDWGAQSDDLTVLVCRCVSAE